MKVFLPGLLLLALAASRTESAHHDGDADITHDKRADKDTTKRPTCVWLEPVDGKRNSGHEKVTLNEISIEDCKAKVDDEKDTMYMSFEYHKTLRRCYLQTVDRHTVRLTTTDANYVYYERDCDENYPDECQWEGPIKDRYIGGTTHITQADVTADMCKAMCEEETTFHCKSFDYYMPTHTCYFKLGNRYGTKLNTHASYQHYERNCYDKFRSCNSAQNASWATEIHGQYLGSGLNVITLTKIDEAGCKEACLQATEYHCMGFDYDHVSDGCRLKTWSRELAPDMAGIMYSNTNYDFHALESCPGAEPVKMPVKNCKWLEPIKAYLSGNDMKTFTGMTADQCKRSCDNEDDFQCISFDYLSANKYCYLSKVNRMTHVISYHNSYVYYEKDCLDYFPEKCEWEMRTGSYIAGNDQKTLTGLSMDECKEACENEETFHCLSFDYRISNKYCYLQRTNMYKVALSKNADYVYNERACFDEFRTCSPKNPATWTGPITGKYISGNDLKSIAKISVDECKKACLQAENFHCTSFDYRRRDNYCFLQGQSRKQVQLSTHGDYEYYEIKECGGKKPEPPKVVEDECTWVGPMENHYMPGNDMKTVTNIDLDECKKLCETETTYKCLSFDYYKSVRYCYLQKADRHIATLSAHAAYDYYERRCTSDPYPKKCEWNGPVKDRYLSGYDHKTVNSVADEEECKKLCEDETTFYCISFDYYYSANRCYLSRNNRYGLALSVSKSYQYYERNCVEKYQDCDADSEGTWVGPILGNYMSSSVRTLANVSPEECKKACLQIEDFHCVAFYRNPSNNYCYLLPYNRGTPDKKLVASASYNYYELVACPSKNNIAPPTKPSTCKWLEPATGKYLSGQDTKTLYNMDFASCKKACEDAAFDCRSFDMYSTNCYLSVADRSKFKLSSHSAYTYTERDCSATFPEECKWSKVINRGYISGNDLKTVYTASIDECKKACEDETEFHCVSFDFYRASERCYLQMVNLYSSTLKLTTHKDYDYYERNCLDKYRNCRDGASAVWEGPYHGKGISGMNIVTLSGITVDECKAACLQQTTFHCRSFDYTRTSKTCYLQSQTRESADLVTATNDDYYEIQSCTLTPTAAPATPKFKWLPMMSGNYISGNDKKTLTNFNLEDCKEACENEKGFTCRSFDYRPSVRYCYLQEVNRHTAVLSVSASYQYYEIDVEDDFPAKCKWEEPKLRSYQGGYKKYLTKISPEDCKKACEDETTFFCISFDYYVATTNCYLNQQNGYSKKVAVNAAYNHYERNCLDNYRNCFDGAAALWSKPRVGKYISGQVLKTLNYMSVEDCKRACLQETTFHCRSYNYHRTTEYCQLSAAITADYKLTASTVFDYYELEKCEGDRPEKRDLDKRAEDEEEEDAFAEFRNAGNGCTWVGPINAQYLSGNDKKTISNVLASDCMKACEEETTFECVSFDYIYSSRRCYLQAVDRSAYKLSTSTSYQYFEKDCNENFPEKCQWEGPIKNRYISGQDLLTLTGVSVESCKSECETQCGFHCTSFDYIPSQQKCLLQLKNRYDMALSTSASYDYYERNCFNTYRACSATSDADWTGPLYGKGLKSFTNLKTISSIDVAECKKACQQSTEFHCRAFRFQRQNGNCYLTALSSEENEIIDDLNYNLYELKGCPGDQPELTDAEVKECEPEDFYVASCACSGDPHCRSFDGKWLHFQGTCFLTAARDNCENGVPAGPPEWEVISNPGAGSVSSPVSYVRGAQINLYKYDLEIGLYPSSVTVNGINMPGSPMSYADGKVKIVRAGQTIVTVKGGVQVVFSSSYLEVRVQTKMRENICGLCGNFNGNQADDWITGNSKYCMSKYPNAKPGEITNDLNVMGTSWTAKIDEVDAKCLYECPNPPHPSGCNNDNAYKAEDHCQTIDPTYNGPFKTCLATMPEFQSKEIFDNCVYDACSLNNYEDIVCRHAASLAKICTDMYNMKITWRSASFCPMTCEENMEYKPCGDPCLPTCGDRGGQNCGDLGPCTEGCFCKSGFVFDGTKCIKESSCGCLVPDLGVVINVGESYKATDCSTSCTCESAGAALKCEDMTCDDNYECLSKGGEPACVCAPPFIEVDGECMELPYPCEEAAPILSCFTCNATDVDNCNELGKMEVCSEGANAICKSTTIKAPSSKTLRVQRNCVSRVASCPPDAIGPDAEFCETHADGKTACYTCSFGPTKPTEDEPTLSECKEEAAPTTTPAPGDPCVMPLSGGNGGQKLTRYYFDAEEEKCSKFKYTGAGGNINNFESTEECEAACGFAPPETCTLPQDKGSDCGGTKSVGRYSFDSKKGKCKKFKYTGCGGNENNFKGKKDCKKACEGGKKKKTKKD